MRQPGARDFSGRARKGEVGKANYCQGGIAVSKTLRVAVIAVAGLACLVAAIWGVSAWSQYRSEQRLKELGDKTFQSIKGRLDDSWPSSSRRSLN